MLSSHVGLDLGQVKLNHAQIQHQVRQCWVLEVLVLSRLRLTLSLLSGFFVLLQNVLDTSSEDAEFFVGGGSGDLDVPRLRREGHEAAPDIEVEHPVPEVFKGFSLLFRLSDRQQESPGQRVSGRVQLLRQSVDLNEHVNVLNEVNDHFLLLALPQCPVLFNAQLFTQLLVF